MKSLITGVAGFIGSHLAEKLLSLGHQVVGIDKFLNNYPRDFKERNHAGFKSHPNFLFLEEDLLRLDLGALLRDVDYVFHLAALPGVRASWGAEFARYSENNIMATQLLLEACKNLPLRKVVYASSSSVYGDTDDLPMREEGITRPVSPYGVSKLAAEHLCYLYWKGYGVPTASLRFFTVYGPRQRPDMFFHILMRAVLRGEPVPLYDDGEQSRDF
ncbi:MAG: NAD-dependent epimerase/dehydratase family protein, partial [Deltaproteobacteria bacterium]|nr:NAD-dependent epimerase/dehydratase family protein [Deltaproteobacteria bacterium]